MAGWRDLPGPACGPHPPDGPSALACTRQTATTWGGRAVFPGVDASRATRHDVAGTRTPGPDPAAWPAGCGSSLGAVSRPGREHADPFTAMGEPPDAHTATVALNLPPAALIALRTYVRLCCL